MKLPASYQKQNPIQIFLNNLSNNFKFYTMKKLISMLALVAFVVATSFAQDDAISKYFEKYVDDDRFSVVYISPKTFNLISKIEIDEMDGELQDVIKGLKGLRILNTSETPDVFYKEAKSKINMKEYELLISARDNNENVRIMVKDNGGDIVQELFMVISGKTEFTMISFIGDIDLKKVGKLAKAIDIDGLQHLKKLNGEKN